MSATRKIEIFSAGCAICDETVALVKNLACPSCDVTVLDMNDAKVIDKARNLGVLSVPAVALDGRLADCCAGRGPNEESLRVAGIGVLV